jgi:LysM repeat protein
MRNISLWLFILIFTASLARAQDDETQQQIDKLSGQVQDLLDAQAAQGKRLDALEKEISDLSDKMNQPGGNNFASADDLKNLAAQVQEIDQKRQDDNQKILDALDKLGKGGISTGHKAPDVSTTTTDNSASTGPQKGYEYKIASGDTLSAIAKAYRTQGVKVTSDQILAANPGLNPKNMTVGKTIFIPQPQ